MFIVRAFIVHWKYLSQVRRIIGGSRINLKISELISTQFKMTPEFDWEEIEVSEIIEGLTANELTNGND